MSFARKKWVVDRHEKKQLITSLGTVNFKKTLFKERMSGNREYLLDRLLHMESHERMTEDAIAKILKEAVQTSYRRGGEEINDLDNVTKQTTMNKIHKLEFPKDTEVIENKKYVKKLYIDADEDHLSLQYQKKKGDLVSGRYGRKNNNIIAKIVYVYEGIEEVSEGDKRHSLINPHYFCSTSDVKDNYTFWQEIYEWIDHHYDLGRIEKIYLNGDGGAWMKVGKDFVDGVITTIEEVFLDSGEIDDVFKDIVSEMGDDIRGILLPIDIYLELPASREKGLKDVVYRVTEYVKERQGLSKNQDERVRRNFNRLFCWMNDNPEKALIHFKEIVDNKHWLYNDEEIALNMKKSREI